MYFDCCSSQSTVCIFARTGKFILKHSISPTRRAVTIAKRMKSLLPHIGICVRFGMAAGQSLESQCFSFPSCPITTRHSLARPHPKKRGPQCACVRLWPLKTYGELCLHFVSSANNRQNRIVSDIWRRRSVIISSRNMGGIAEEKRYAEKINRALPNHKW